MPRLIRVPLDDLGLTVRGGPTGCAVCRNPVHLMLRESEGRLFIVCSTCRSLGWEIQDGDFSESDSFVSPRQYETD